MRAFVAAASLILMAAAGPVPGRQDLQPTATPGPVAEGAARALRFAVVGDAGTGERPQYDVADRLAASREGFPFEFVLLLGDNMYGRQNPEDFAPKFERPYHALIDAHVPFFAVLGNHDKPDNRNYPGFGMQGQRYYTFARNDVRFVALDTNQMEPRQVAWLEETLRGARERWKIAYLHHPLYSNGGRHGSNVELRVMLEPILVRYGVAAVFAGHEHIYERLTPQRGITHFVVGSSGQLRRGDLNRSATTAAGFDDDRAFMLIEIAGEQMSFRTISRTGVTVDSGTLTRRPTT